MTALVVLIPGRPPTPNSKGDKKHWAMHWRAMREWRETAYLLGLDLVNRERWRAPERARMLVTFLVPNHQRRDLDNLVASTKPLTDGLVDAGVLRDDSLDVLVEVAYRWKLVPGYTGTEYRVEPASESTLDLWATLGSGSLPTPAAGSLESPRVRTAGGSG